MNPDLQKYVIGAQKAGRTREQITQDLKSGGWTDQDIAEAFKVLTIPVASTTSFIPPQPVRSVEAPKTFKHKALLFASIFVLVLGLVGGYLYSSNSPLLIQFMGNFSSGDLKNEEGVLATGESADLAGDVDAATQAKINFTNKSGLFSLSLPEGWGSSPNYDNAEFTTDKSLRHETNGHMAILIEGGKDINNHSKDGLKKSGHTISNEEDLIIDGFKAQKFQYGAPSFTENIVVIPILHNNKIAFNITAGFESSDLEELKVMNNMIKNLIIHKDKILSVAETFDPELKKTNMEAKLESLPPGLQERFISSSGVFSLSYPSNWISFERDEVMAEFIIKDSSVEGGLGNFNISLAPAEDATSYYSPESLKKSGYTVSNQGSVIIAGVSAKKFIISNEKLSHTMYIMPSASKDLSIVIAFNLSDKVKIAEVSSALNTLKIDSAKIADFLEREKIKAEEANLKAGLSNLRASAELYYDSHTSYAGLCSSQGDYFSKGLDLVKQQANNKVKCSDSPAEYAVSEQFPNGNYYCIDSTGFYHQVASFHTGFKCPTAINTSQ